MWKPIYEVIGLVKRKICTRLLSGPGRLSRAPAKAGAIKSASQVPDARSWKLTS
jgi:hypothetical protein